MTETNEPHNYIKKPPHSIEAEQALLGGLMLNNSVWDVVFQLISEADFYQANHQIIFSALFALLRKDEPADVLLVNEYLIKNKQAEKAGGFDYLIELADNTPSIANIEAYAKHVRELSVLRALIRTTSEIAQLAYQPNTTSSDELLDNAEKKIFDIGEQLSQKQKSIVNVKDIIPDIVDRINEMQDQQGLTGLETGFEKFDEKTSGLQNGDLVIIAGRPSMGKTAFAMNMVEHVAMKLNKPVAVFSLEMSTEQLVIRLITSFGHINATKIRDGTMSDIDWPRFNTAVKALEKSTILIDETPSIGPMEIRAKCRRLKRQYPELAMIVVDYLQLMSVSDRRAENRVQEISEISRALKAMAKELNLPVVALSQLNRAVEMRPREKKGRMPQMADLRESGSIEQDADIVTFIYRDEQYHNDAYPAPTDIDKRVNKPQREAEKGKADISIAKHRNGETGNVRLAFKGEFTRFENLDPADYSDEPIRDTHSDIIDDSEYESAPSFGIDENVGDGQNKFDLSEEKF